MGRVLCFIGFHRWSDWKFGGGSVRKCCVRWGCKKEKEGIAQDIIDSRRLEWWER